MAIYVGEAVAVRAQATNPFTKAPIIDLTGVAEFYAPGRDPKKVPADRATPDDSVSVAYDASAEGYLAFWPTAGKDPGKWTVRIHLTGGDYDNFEFGTVTLVP